MNDKNPADAVREALARFDDLIGAHGNKLDADALTTLETEFAALTSRVAELETAEREAFQKYVDANEARIDAEAKADAHARDAGRLAKLRKRAKQSTAYDVHGNGGHWSVGFHSADNRLSFDEALDAMQEPQP